MDMATPSNEKIQEALELLRQAAIQKKEELRGMVRDQYSDVRDVMGGFTANIGAKARMTMDNMSKAAEVSREKIREAALNVDECAHEKPWHFMGGVAIGALLLGFILGKRQ